MRRRSAVLFLAAAVASSSVAGCAARDVGEAVRAGGKIAYDSFKAGSRPPER